MHIVEVICLFNYMIDFKGVLALLLKHISNNKFVVQLCLNTTQSACMSASVAQCIASWRIPV